MKRSRSSAVLAAAACAAALLSGCGGSDSTVLGPGASPSSSEVPAPAQEARTAQIYAAVIRKLVLGANGSAPDSSPYKRIWVVDHEVVNAAQPGEADRPGQTFSETLMTDLKQALVDLPALAFVSDPNAAVVADDPPMSPPRDQIRGRGTVILLGPIETHGDRVHVGHELWCAAHCAEWFTSVLQQRDGAWVVTGEAGPHAIT
jgi:hypothetical protein